MFGLTLNGLRHGGRKTRRVRRRGLDMVATWLGGARLNAAPEGQLAKRRHYRWTWQKRLMVRTDVEKLRVRTFDLSEAGAGLFLPQRLTLGSPIWISNGDDETWVAARVVHIDGPDERGLFRTGVEFVSLESEKNAKA